MRSVWRGRFGLSTYWLGCVFLALPATAAVTTYPTYTTSSIVNSATQTAEALAPNCLATIYGANLAFNTIATVASAQPGSILPTSLDGVSVLVDGFFASLFFISPGQINFVVPYDLRAGTVTVEVVRQGAAGPSVQIQLNATSPGLFPWNGNVAIATHLSGALISAAAPAQAGEIIVLFADGLGRVTPDTQTGRLAQFAAKIVAAAQMQVMLGGVAVPAPNILYAGLAPGFSGLYQINLKLPDTLPANPEIRVAFGSLISSPQIILPAIASAPPVASN